MTARKIYDKKKLTYIVIELFLQINFCSCRSCNKKGCGKRREFHCIVLYIMPFGIRQREEKRSMEE